MCSCSVKTVDIVQINIDSDFGNSLVNKKLEMAELFKFLSATRQPSALKTLMKGIGIYLGMPNASKSDQNETTLTQ